MGGLLELERRGAESGLAVQKVPIWAACLLDIADTWGKSRLPIHFDSDQGEIVQVDKSRFSVIGGEVVFRQETAAHLVSATVTKCLIRQPPREMLRDTSP